MAKIPVILEAGRADGKLASSDSIFDENKGMFQSELNDIQDTLNSDNPNKPLSANQGKVLKELLDNKVIEAGSVPIDTKPIEGNTTHVVNSDGLAKEFNKCNTAIITTDRIEDGAVTTEKIATSAFDSTLSVSGKIAPADVVGAKLNELEKEMMTLQYPDIIDVTHLFYQGGLFDGTLNGAFAPNVNNRYRYCAVFKTKVGNVFEVTNLIGGNTPAWIKYDKNGKRVSTAEVHVTINETLVMEHDGYIVFNHLGTSSSGNFNVKTNAEILPINVIIGLENLRKDTEISKLDIDNNKESIVSLKDSVQQISCANIDNIIDYDTIIEGIVLDQNKGTTSPSSVYSTTELIPVAYNATYEFSTGVRRLSQYDYRGEYIDGTSIDHISTFTTKSEAKYIKVSIFTSLVNKLTCKIVKGGYNNKYRIRDKYGNFYALDESMSYWSNKKVIIFGDSSTAGNASVGTNWFARMCDLLGVKYYKNFAISGQTILNQEGASNNYLKASIEQAIEYISTNLNGSVDIIMLQIGGNDMGRLSEIGSAEDAFSSYNYLTYKHDKTIYGSLRYCLELLRRTYPQAMITMGTVFGRLGSNYNGNAKEINDVITTCCDAMKIQVIDGGKYMGFSPFTEISSPYYNDNNPNVVNDRTALSRTNPAYNFINDDTGEIVTYDVATNGGVLKSGYSKRYGLYTYDGKHQTKEGEDKVMMFMYNELKRLV